MVRWQSTNRNRRNTGLRLAVFALALVGGGVAVVDLAGVVDLEGVASLAPLGMILPWVSLTAASLIRSSLDWVAG